MAHRPLSKWITAVELTEDGVAQWSPLADVNYGDEQVNARALPRFSDGWRRQAIPLNVGYLALGLVHDGSGEAVIEVDDHARPVRVSEAAARVIGRLEDSWPDVPRPVPGLAVFEGEGEAVRYLLAERLAAAFRPPQDPPAELFHILPWKLVDRLTEQVAWALDGIAPPPDVIELRHWFNPADAKFTAALEQLDEGLRDREQDPALARVAATALCSLLLEAVPERLPELTRAALAQLTERLAQEYPLLAFTARRARQLLLEGEAEPVEALRQELRSSSSSAAADTGTEAQRKSIVVVREPFTVRLAVPAGDEGEVAVEVSAPLSPDPQDGLIKPYGVVLFPVKITDEVGTTRYVIALRSVDNSLSGGLELPLPSGDFVEADIDGPPFGVSEVVALSLDEVRHSIRPLQTWSDLEPWNQVAESLSETDPLRALITEAIGDTE